MKATIISINDEQFLTEHIDLVRKEIWLSDGKRLVLGKDALERFIQRSKDDIQAFLEGDIINFKIVKYE